MKQRPLYMNFKSWLLTIVTLSWFFLGCGSGGGGELQPERLRVVHAASEESMVDVYIDDLRVVNDLPYGDASSYLEIEEGDRQIRFIDSGAFDLIDETQTIEAGLDYTLFLIDDGGTLDELLITDDNTVPDTDQGRLRIGHLAPSLDNLDIYVTRPGVSLSDETPVVSGIEYKSFSAYLDVNVGEVQIRVTNNDSKRVLIDSGEINLTSGQVLSFLLLDEEGGGTPAETLLLVDRN